MKKISLFIISFTFLASSLAWIPATVFAQAATTTGPKLDYSGFVKCDGVLTPGEEHRQTECDFAALMDTINKIINWAFILSIPVATALFAYAGLLYMTGSSGNVSKAKSIFVSVGKGFIIVIVAWMLVYTVVNWIVSPAYKNTAGTFLDTK